MKSISTMLKQLAGLVDTSDVTDWESQFLGDVIDRMSRPGATTEDLSGKQVEKIEQIYQKHFA